VVKFLVVLLGLASLSARAAAQERVARLYALGGEPGGAPLFTQRIHLEADSKGRRVQDSTISDQNGNIVMTEKAILEGSRIVSQDVEQRQVGEAYTLEVKENKATYRTFALQNGKRVPKSAHTSDAPPEFVTGPAVEAFLRERLGAKLASEAIAADFGVFEIERSVPFEFRLTGVKEGGKVIKVRLKPANWWISMVVAPIDLELDAKTFELVRYQGRTPLKRKINGNWKPFDSQILYSPN